MLSHVLECEPCTSSYARRACKSHQQHKDYLVADTKGLLVEPAKSKEALWEVQAQSALATPGHRTNKILP